MTERLFKEILVAICDPAVVVESAMRGYDEERDGYDDYYEDEGQEEYEEDGEGEYEEEEEEPRKPSKEEQEYLELRQKLKDHFRKKLKKDSGSSTSRLDSTDRRKNKLPYDNYGSFFGPSQPAIAPRVIEESKSFIENKHLASKVSNPHHIKKNPNKVPSGESKSSSHNLLPKVREMKVKAEKLKNRRDYSFLLSDDVELPAPSKARPPQNMPVQNSEGRPAQVPARSKLPLSNGKHVYASHEEQKLGSAAGRLPPKSGSSYKTSSTCKPSMALVDSRKQLGSNTGNGPGRPVGPKGLPPKISVATSGNKSSTPGKNHVNSVQKSLPSKSHLSIPKQSMEQRILKQSMEQRISKQSMEQRIPKQSMEQRIPKQSVEQRKDIRELNRPKMTPKQPVASSKLHINKPLKQNSMHTTQNHRPKPKVAKRPFDDEEDEMDISNMIRSMFNYNPRNFVDDDDDDDMEAGFDEIMREERRSAKIAKKEDEEQLRLIEEEEERERERRRRMAKLKKRKLNE